MGREAEYKYARIEKIIDEREVRADERRKTLEECATWCDDRAIQWHQWDDGLACAWEDAYQDSAAHFRALAGKKEET